MNDHMRDILESKRRERQRLAALPFAEKIPILEALRDRALMIEGSALYQTHGAHTEKARMVRESDTGSRPK